MLPALDRLPLYDRLEHKLVLLRNSLLNLAEKFGYKLVDDQRWQALTEIEQEAEKDLRPAIAKLKAHIATLETPVQQAQTYRYHGQFNVPVDQFIHERYFGSSLLKGRFLECGGADGIGESCCLFFEETLGWTGVNVEASPPLFKMLAENRPDALNIHAALSDSDGMVEFTHAYHPTIEVFGNGSVSHTVAHREELDSFGCTYEKFSVKAISYRSLIADYGIDHLDLMVLDVEGFEEAALKGMYDAPVLPTVMCVEFGITGPDKVRSMMSDLGYSFDTTSFGNAFYVKQDRVSGFRRWRSE